MSDWSKCKQCNSEHIVKNGKQDGVQPISVKIVGLRGKEAKYSPEFKLDAIMMYINSMGIREISRESAQFCDISVDQAGK